jgi:hypothetical protein
MLNSLYKCKQNKNKQTNKNKEIWQQKTATYTQQKK